MDKTVVYLIRHGEIDNPQNVFYGRTISVQLTQKGRDDIEAIGQKIRTLEKKIAIVYTSPLARTLESAKILSSVLGRIPIKIDEDFIEVDVPALVGHSTSEKQEFYARGIDEYSEEFVALGNESREAIARRMFRGMHRILDKDKGKTVVVVSHGDPMAILHFRLIHPDTKIPLLFVLGEEYYPEKSEGFVVSADDQGKVEAITPLTLHNITGHNNIV